MANFNAAVLTLKGISLLAKTQAGQTGIEFTKAASGSGSYEPGELLLDKEALKDQRQEFPFDKLSVENKTTVSVKFTITNEQETGNLQEGYHVKEVGIFAADPDEGEVLYAIATAVEDRWDYMPAYNSLMPAYITVEFYAEVSNASEVTIRSAGRFVTAEEMEAELQAIEKLITGLDEKFITAENAKTEHNAIKKLIEGCGEVPEGVLTQTDKGAKNGVASLDSSGRLLYKQIPVDSGAVRVTKMSLVNYMTWKASADGEGWIGTGEESNQYPEDIELVKVSGTGRWIEMVLIPDVSQLYSSYVESYADKAMHLYRKSNVKVYCRFNDNKCYFKAFADSDPGSSELKNLGFHAYVLRTGKPSY